MKKFSIENRYNMWFESPSGISVKEHDQPWHFIDESDIARFKNKYVLKNTSSEDFWFSSKLMDVLTFWKHITHD